MYGAAPFISASPKSTQTRHPYQFDLSLKR